MPGRLLLDFEKPADLLEVRVIQVLTGDEESLKRIKRFRCSVCQYDATLIITLLAEAAIEESKVTTQPATRTHTCPSCGTVAQLQAWTEREAD